jgi:hypothetical protein
MTNPRRGTTTASRSIVSTVLANLVMTTALTLVVLLVATIFVVVKQRNLPLAGR